MTPLSNLLDLRPVGIMVAAAALLVVLARPLRLPSIVAFILAGLLLVPLTGFAEASEMVDLIGEAGVALLLFVVGLELRLEKLKDVGPAAGAAALAQVALCTVAGLLLLAGMGWQPREAWIVAGAVALSSTAVAVKLLDERRELDHLHGRLALGILLVQDVLAIGALTALAGAPGQDASTSFPDRRTGARPSFPDWRRPSWAPPSWFARPR